MNASRGIDIQTARQHLSEARLTPYLTATSSSQEALALYEENILVSMRFMLVMHFLEIVLRNDMDAAMRQLLGLHWFTRPDALREAQAKQVAQAMNNLRRQKKPPSHDNIIADLPLGFWVGLLTKQYEYRQQYWRRCLHACFPLRPRHVQRHELHDRLNRIRRFRNRVAHHERILHRHPDIMIRHALQALAWISPEMRNWAQRLLDRMP